MSVPVRAPRLENQVTLEDQLRNGPHPGKLVRTVFRADAPIEAVRVIELGRQAVLLARDGRYAALAA